MSPPVRKSDPSRVRDLLVRFPEYGINPDTAVMSLCELWGVYRFLAGVAERAGT